MLIFNLLIGTDYLPICFVDFDAWHRKTHITNKGAETGPQCENRTLGIHTEATSPAVSSQARILHGPLTRYKNCGLRMRRKCRERFPCHRLQSKPLVRDSGMHRGTYVTYVSWWMSGLLTRCGVENVPSIPHACATCNFMYLARGPCATHRDYHKITISAAGSRLHLRSDNPPEINRCWF